MDNKPKIIVNGQEVDPGQIPEQLRDLMKDANQNGIPDILENVISQVQKFSPTAAQAMQQYFVDGKVYQNFESMPEDVRTKIQARLAQIPNMLATNNPQASNVTMVSSSSVGWSGDNPSLGNFQSSGNPQGYSPQSFNPQNFPGIQTGGGSRTSLLIGILIALIGILMVGGLVVYLLWRKF